MVADDRVPLIALASLHAGAIAVLLATNLGLATRVEAATSRIGRVWPIAEPDALAEIEAKQASLPPLKDRFGSQAGWTALRSAPLGVTRVSATRSVVPFYTLDQDLKLPDGRTLYPKGFTFNPLTYVRLTQRLVIVHPSEIGWALSIARPTDWIIVTGGNVLDLEKKVSRPLFLLEEQVKSRLGLTVAPVIVAQSGQKLLLNEVRVDPRPGSPS